MVSVTGVDVSPDLADARVRVSVVPEKYEPRVLRGLQSAAGRLRKEITNHARLRRVPKLTFEVDSSIKRQAELEALVREGSSDSDPAEGHDEVMRGDDKEARGT